MRLSQSERIPSTDGWRPLRIEADAPAGCDRAWLLLKSSAEADVTFREVHFRAAGSDGERTPNAALDPQAGAWGFTAWSAGQEDALRSEWDPGELRIRYAPRDDHAVPARWVEDWFDFTGDALAEFIGHVADGIRAAAPGKPIIAYLTFAFAAPFNWDYSYDTNVHPPKVFAARRYEGLGMQLSAADGDYHHVTAGIDMVRHLGDPWMIDLQDFTSGVAIGAPAMTETTRAGIAAGARGAVYYCWYGTPDYNFHRDWPDGDVRAMVLSGRDLLGETAATTVPVDVALLHPMRVPYEGAGERDPGRFYLLYGACRRLGLGIRIVTRREDAPEGVPLLTVDDVPRTMHVHLRRTTEAGNTPPMFKRQAGESCTAQSIAQLAEALAGRLGLTMPPRDTERFPVVGADGVRRDVGVARVPWVRAPW